MKVIIFSVVLCLIISCVYGQIDKPCTQDNDCDQSNKFLCIQSSCRCKIGYRKLDNSPTCRLVLGTECQTNDDCANLPGALCDENKKCICEAGFTAGKEECDKLGGPNDPCKFNSECVRILKDDNSECKNNACSCKEGYHKSANDKCLKTAGLNDHCENSNDCYLIVKDQNALECSNKVCKCRENFKEKDGTCNGSNEILALSIPIIIFLVMGLLKF